MTNDALVDALKEEGTVETPGVEAALRAVDRADFVRDEEKDAAYLDTALPIGKEQTISQPTVVAYCLELLDAQPGDRVLDVGSGSGYTTALLARIVGEGGEVIGVERIPELVAFGRENLVRYAQKNARIEAAGAALGKPETAPFDRILVSAAADELPKSLARQLVDGGRMVIPLGDALCTVDRKGDEFKTTCHEGYAFVPLIEEV